MYRVLIMAAVLLWTLPGTAVAQARAAAGARAPDVIYHHGKIVTVNAKFDVAEAIAFTDGKIEAVGANAAVMALASPATKLVDLQGKTAVPGLGDGHMHMGSVLELWEGKYTPQDSKWLVGMTTPAQLAQGLKEQDELLPRGQWLLASLPRPVWGNDKIPTRWQLDSVVPDRPVRLGRGHTNILNSMAIQLAGLTPFTPQGPGGWIWHDAQGQLNGWTADGGNRYVSRVIPPTPRRTDEEILVTYRSQLTKLLSIGITHVEVAGMRPADLRLLQVLYERWGNELPRMRAEIRLYPGYNEHEDPVEGAATSIAEIEGLGFHTGWGNDRLKIGSIKMNFDGGLSAPIFWSAKPYKGTTDFFGATVIPEDALYKVSKRAHELGWQVAIHTIGDAAIISAVKMWDQILSESPRKDARPILHHFTVKPPDATLKKMADLGIVVSNSPSWLTALGSFTEVSLEGERLETQNPTRSLMEKGIHVAFGSDQLPYGPIFNIWSAVTRKGYGDREYGKDKEAVNVQVALRAHTMEEAYMAFEENLRGSLEVGKLADMVVLGEDILTVPADRMKFIPVLRTIVGGKEVFTGSGPVSTK